MKETDANAAICNFCKTVISSVGGEISLSYTTSNMLKHLRTFHTSDMQNFKEEDEDVGDFDVNEESNSLAPTAGPNSNPTFEDVPIPRGRPSP